MNTKRAVLLVGFLLGGAAIAQPVKPNSAKQSAPANALWDSPVAATDSESVEADVVVSKEPAAIRLLKIEKSDQRAARRIETDSRAWTILASWSPGTSAFADPMTHESKLVLFTVRAAK
jgi:hypothetical protein